MTAGDNVLFAEPAGPFKVCGLNSARFAAELRAAAQVGLETVARPAMHWSHAALLRRA